MDNKYYLKFWRETLVRRNFASYSSKSIHTINFLDLNEKGYELLIFDYDDTLADFHGSVSEKTKTLLINLSKDFRIAIHSNFPLSREKAMRESLKGLDMYFCMDSNKPNPKGYLEIMNHFSVDKSKIVMIGDRVGTDLYGAYLAGIEKRILVRPYSYEYGGRKTKFLNRVFRSIETIFD